MTKIDYSKYLPKDQFPVKFKTKEKVQRVMDKLAAFQASHMKNVFDYIEDESRDKLNLEESTNEFEKLNARIPLLESNLEEATHKDLIKDLTAELTRATMRRDALERRLSRRDESDLILDEMKYINSRFNAESIDDWVDMLGNWFSEGHLGAGSVTYRDKTYTAE